MRTESAAAISYWWGVHSGVVWRWRKLLGVTQTNNPRTHQLVSAASQAGGAALKEKTWTEEERAAKRLLAKRLNYRKTLQTGYHGPRWTAAQLKLLGKLPDDEVARRIGRTPNAVRIKRDRLRIAKQHDRRITAPKATKLI